MHCSWENRQTVVDFLTGWISARTRARALGASAKVRQKGANIPVRAKCSAWLRSAQAARFETWCGPASGRSYAAITLTG